MKGGIEKAASELKKAVDKVIARIGYLSSWARGDDEDLNESRRARVCAVSLIITLMAFRQEDLMSSFETFKNIRKWLEENKCCNMTDGDIRASRISDLRSYANTAKKETYTNLRRH